MKQGSSPKCGGGAWLLALALLLGPGMVRGQPAPASPQVVVDPEQALAKGRERAEALEGAGKLAEARDVYQKLYDDYQSPRDLWPLTLLHLRLCEPEAGLQKLDQYQGRMPSGSKPPGRDREETLVRQLLQQGKERKLCEPPPAQVVCPPELTSGRRATQPVVPLPPGPTAPPVAPLTPPRGLKVAKWVLGGIGLAGIATGAVLWGLDGRQACVQAPMCATELSTVAPGAALVGAGVGLLGASAVMFGIDYRSSRSEKVALVTVGGRF